MHKAIREFLEAKLRALKLASSEDAVGRDLPGRIILWPPPKDEVEAKLYGILEGLHAAGKITGGEASDWAMRFRSVRVRPGDPGTVFIYPSGQIPAEVRLRNEPWPRGSISLAIEPVTPARGYDTGLLTLIRVELYPPGISLHWRLDLSESAEAAIDKARKQLRKSPPDLLEFHLTRRSLPPVQAISMSDARADTFSILDMDSNFAREDQIRAVTRFTPRPDVPAQLTVTWAGRTFAFSLDQSSRNA